MVTGSHIPADRNGLKFYIPGGEITKDDETAILAALGCQAQAGGLEQANGPEPLINTTAGPDYVARHVTAFGPRALAGMRLGVYAHSAVGRDLLAEILSSLGAAVVDLGRSAIFIPVDTEAVDAATRAQLHAWAAAMPLDAILSTDGDGDRPLLTDAAGGVIPGDVLGQITAAALGADVVVTPVSSNSGAELSGAFGRVIRTRIGSPHVIAGMASAGATARVAGYEANGGFLLGFDAAGSAGPLCALMTRDSLLPMIVPLMQARQGGLAALVARQPARFTATDRLQDVATDRTRALIAGFGADAGALARFLGKVLGGSPATPVATDRTDGLRLRLAGGEIVHLRPSGNAPELRLYTEAATPDAARLLLKRGLAALAQHLRG
jgi:phosphomannomutase